MIGGAILLVRPMQPVSGLINDQFGFERVVTEILSYIA